MKATGIVRRIEACVIRTSRRIRKQVFGGWENLVTPYGRNRQDKSWKNRINTRFFADFCPTQFAQNNIYIAKARWIHLAFS